MEKIQKVNVLIIGGGPAGYTAAIYCARAALEPVQALGPMPGGQLMITTDVENYPGFAQAVQGPWLMEQMHKQAEHVGTKMVYSFIEKVDFSSRPFKCWGDDGVLYEAKSVIIATGAQAKWLSIPGEQDYMGFGVSGCATCDGFFFKNKRVAVVGGGNTAVEEALYLTNHAQEVVLIHRRDSLRAEKIAQDRLFKHPKIKVIFDTVVEQVLGNDGPPKALTGLRVKNLKTNEIADLPFDGFFVAIGHSPMTAIFKDQIEMDSEGYLIAQPNSTCTNVPGVFAAGDVQDKIYRQAVTAAGQGCMAAIEVEKFLNH